MTFGDWRDVIGGVGFTEGTARTVVQVIGAALIGALTLVARRLTRRAMRVTLTRARTNPQALLVTDRVVQVAVLLTGGLWIADLFELRLGALGTILGISGVAIGLAVQDVLKQFVAGMYLMVEHPFTLGDRIVVPAGQGTIRRIEWLSTMIDLPDGGVVVVPNSWFLTNTVVARKPDALVSFRVTVTVKDTNPNAANADALISAFVDCARSSSAISMDTPVEVLVRGWTTDGPLVDISGRAEDRDQAINSLAWAVRERFGNDLIEMRDS